MLNNEAKRRATAFILAMAHWPVVPDDLYACVLQSTVHDKGM